jgi:hypothetical protein
MQPEYEIVNINPPKLLVSQSVIESNKMGVFIRERIGEKLVDAIAGIGPETKNKMNNDKLFNAEQLVGYYLMKQRNQKDLETLLKSYGMNGKNLISAKTSIMSWVDNFC